MITYVMKSALKMLTAVVGETSAKNYAELAIFEELCRQISML